MSAGPVGEPMSARQARAVMECCDEREEAREVALDSEEEEV